MRDCAGVGATDRVSGHSTVSVGSQVAVLSPLIAVPATAVWVAPLSVKAASEGAVTVPVVVTVPSV